MTLQFANIKTGSVIASGADHGAGLVGRWAAAVLQWRRRKREREDFRAWMRQERGLRDMGLEAFEAEIESSGSLLRSQLPYDSMLFQHRGTRG